MSDWKTGDRVKIGKEHADGFHQPYAGLIRQGRGGTLRVMQRAGMCGVEVMHEVTFDVLRAGAKPQKLVLDEKFLERLS